MFYLAIVDFEDEYEGCDPTDQGMLSDIISIYDEYINKNAPNWVNLSAKVSKGIMQQFKTGTYTWEFFAVAKREVYELLTADVFMRFQSSPLFQDFLKEFGAYEL